MPFALFFIEEEKRKSDDVTEIMKREFCRAQITHVLLEFVWLKKEKTYRRKLS